MSFLIDRYIAKSFLIYFVSGLLVFVTIFLTVDFMSVFAQNQVSPVILMKFYGYYLPSIAHQMIPVACLLATLFTLSNLNKSNELVALFGMGLSLARISAPILSMIAIISALAFWMSDRIIPNFVQKKNYTWYVEIKNQPGRYATVKNTKIWYRSENILFNISTLHPEADVAHGLSFYYFDSHWNLVQTIKAQVAKMRPGFWDLEGGAVTIFTQDKSFPLTKEFAKKTITMNEDVVDLGSSSQPSEVQTLGELNKFIQKNREAGLDTTRYEVDYHSKFGFAFAAFVMSLMGIPFCVSHHRSGKGVANVGLCVGLAFLYWMAFSSSVTLGRNGLLPPMLSAWLPNGMMVGFAAYFIHRLKK